MKSPDETITEPIGMAELNKLHERVVSMATFRPEQLALEFAQSHIPATGVVAPSYATTQGITSSSLKNALRNSFCAVNLGWSFCKGHRSTTDIDPRTYLIESLPRQVLGISVSRDLITDRASLIRNSLFVRSGLYQSWLEVLEEGEEDFAF